MSDHDKEGSTELENAVTAVLRHSVSINKAAKTFNIPRATLQRYIRFLKNPDEATPAQRKKLKDKFGHRRFESRNFKGPFRSLNCQIRTLRKSAGNAIDELSNDLLSKGKQVFKLGLGQSPFPIPSCVVNELRSHAYQRGYLSIAGLPALRREIAKWGTATLDIPFTEEDVIVGPGTKELLFVLQNVYYGDLLLPNPSCTSYAPQAKIAGRNMSWLPTYAEDRWMLRPEVLESHCSEDSDAPRILILNSPSNPTGCVYHHDELLAIAEIARKYRLLVVSDEIYADLNHTNTHCSISMLYPEGTIVSGGLSKWCGAGGWRVGFWLFPPNLNWLREYMLVMASETYTSVASPIQYASLRAFRLNCPELEQYKRSCRTILRVVGQWCTYELQKSNVDVQPPEGGFYLFVSFDNYRQVLLDRGIQGDASLCEKLLHDTGVAILPGSNFGRDPTELTARIAFVDFDGETAICVLEEHQYLHEYSITLEKSKQFMQEVCPNIVISMENLTKWLVNGTFVSV